MSELTVVKPGQSISDAVKQDLQQSAAAKQLVEMKRQMTPKFCSTLNALFQNHGIPDPDFACSVSVSYAASLAIGTGTSKEDFFKGVEKAWAQEMAGHEEVKEQQGKMLLNVCKQLMAQQRPIDPRVITQLKAMAVTIPEDLQKYIEAPPAPSAPAASERPPDQEVKN